MGKRYILTQHGLSGAPDELPVVDGVHEYDYDLDEAACPEDWVREHRAKCIRAWESRHGLAASQTLLSRPMGFSRERIAERGMVLTEVNDD